MKLSNLTYCYEGIQRIYRNAIVSKLRIAMTEAFPETFILELRKPFPAEDWKNIQSNAYKPRVSGQIASIIKDDFDLLSVNHFFNLFERNYELLFPPPKDAAKVEKRTDKKRVLEWCRMVKDLRDPASHPAQEDFNYEDSFVLLDCARRVLTQLQLQVAVKEIKDVIACLSGQVKAFGEPLEGALPASDSIVSDFIGREKELTQLWDWVSNPTTRRWALSGAGGKGKTAIAYEFALDVREKGPDPLQVVLWLSAKKKRFTEGEIVAVPTPDFRDLDSALNQLLFQYGWLEEISRGLEAKRARVLELLNEFPSLIVVDDIDSIESSEEDVIEFFSFSVPQTRSKVLLTSRRVIWGMATTTTQVSGFSPSDLGRFITSRCQMFGLDRAVFNSLYIKEISAVTEGSPLYIEDLMRLMSILGLPEAIKTWAEKRGEPARQYALGRELDLLSKEARYTLLAASFYPSGVSFEELRAVTGYADDLLTDSLAQLQGLFLLPQPRLIEGESRFEINVNVRALVVLTQGKSDAFRAVESAFKSVSGALPRVGRGHVAALIRQAVLLVKNNEEDQAEMLLQRALELHPNDPDLFGVLGFVYRRMQPTRNTDARTCFVRSHQLNNKTDEMYKHWAKMELELCEWTKASEAAEKGLQKRPTSKQLSYLAGLARSKLGQEMLNRSQSVSAGEEFRKSLDHFFRAQDMLGASKEDANLNANIFRGIVISGLALDDREIVLKTFQRWFTEFPSDGVAISEWERISQRMGLSHFQLGRDVFSSPSS